MSLLKAIKAQLGLSTTATQNFTLTAEAADGTMKLARGNADATTQDILTVDASGNVNAPVGLKVGGTAVGTGTAVMTLGTAQATTSGTSIDFTSIPAWVKRITVGFVAVSQSGTSPRLLQIGTSSGIENTGYDAGANQGGTSIGSSAGFILQNSAPPAANNYSGVVTLTYMGSNTWVSMSVLAANSASATGTFFSAGSKVLSGTLDRLRLTTVNGTDTFDAGSVNILYEG